MLLFKVLGITFLSIIITAVSGWFPTKYLESRVGTFNPGFRLFSSVFVGYLLVQAIYAISATNGMSMQILNFLPFVLLGFLPAQAKNSGTIERFSPKDFLIPSGIILMSGLYFLYSYSHDFTKIDRYPFIDMVSYAASAYGMGQANAEVYFSDMALYFPGMTRLNLYHFTELWFTRLLVDCSGQTELWIFCLVIPVFSFALLSMGLLSISESRKVPSWILFVLILSFFFALGKLLFFQDVFIYHILDLFGQKNRLANYNAFVFMGTAPQPKCMAPLFTNSSSDKHPIRSSIGCTRLNWLFFLAGFKKKLTATDHGLDWLFNLLSGILNYS